MSGIGGATRGLLCMSFSLAAGIGFAADDGIFGEYVSVGNYNSTMRIVQSHGMVKIVLEGGASKTSKMGGADVAGDCEAVAEGTFDGKEIHAHLVPFEDELMSLDADDIKSLPDPLVHVKFANGRAIVSGNFFSLCGLGNDMTGAYKRKQQY